MSGEWSCPELANPVLDDEAWNVPDWLSDEDCSHEIGADWRSRRNTQAGGDEE